MFSRLKLQAWVRKGSGLGGFWSSGFWGFGALGILGFRGLKGSGWGLGFEGFRPQRCDTGSVSCERLPAKHWPRK